MHDPSYTSCKGDTSRNQNVHLQGFGGKCWMTCPRSSGQSMTDKARIDRAPQKENKKKCCYRFPLLPPRCTGRAWNTAREYAEGKRGRGASCPRHAYELRFVYWYPVWLYAPPSLCTSRQLCKAAVAILPLACWRGSSMMGPHLWAGWRVALATHAQRTVRDKKKATQNKKSMTKSAGEIKFEKCAVNHKTKRRDHRR